MEDQGIFTGGHSRDSVVQNILIKYFRTIGIFCKVQGRKRIILGENGVLARPSGGWTNKTFYPLHPPRSSRPSTARSSRDSRPMTPSTHEIRSDPMEGNNGSLLHGTYDEAAAAADFQAAVQQFRNGGQENHTHSGTGSSAVDQENQISEADKLKEVTNLFRSFSNGFLFLIGA